MVPQNPNEEEWKKILDETMNDPIPEKLDERMENAIRAFRGNLSNHPYIQSTNRRKEENRWNIWLHSLKLAWPLALILIFVMTLHSFLFGNSNPSWAEVTKQFKSIPFVHAIVYAKEMTSVKAMQFEIWMGEGGKVRVGCGHQIVFADKRGIQKTYDILQRREAEADDSAVHVVKLLNSAETFSLETVIRTVTGHKADLRPVPSRVEGVSNDLRIFDLAPEKSSERIRIWTLRESLLPIQLQQRNLETGESIDVFFSYLQQQPDSFFDPRQFEAILQDASKEPAELIGTF
ncbi:MAG: hypothetical protein AB1656_21750 [Candidatus Omnitrophota bacterium]